MSIIGPNLAGSVAGAHQQERVEARTREQQKATTDRSRRPLRDEFEIVSDIEQPDAVRALKGNADEEAHEDRQQKNHYGSATSPDAARGRTVDLEG